VEPESGTPYRADDPELLLWVHCCEIDSFLSTARRCGARIDDADTDRYVAEQVRAAKLVGLSAADVPASTAALADYFVAMRPQLRVTAEARRAARIVLAPPMPAWISQRRTRPPLRLLVTYNDSPVGPRRGGGSLPATRGRG